MSTSTKDDTSRMEPANDSTKDATPSAGRVVHDSRGNAVWNWDKGNDPTSTASTSKILRKLDFGNLQVEGAAQPEKPAETKVRGSGYGGYDPYDRTAPIRVVPKK
jgi:hypothetical protein